MENEIRLSQFKLGDKVFCKPVKDVDVIAGLDSFTVIRKTGDELVIGNKNCMEMVVSPFFIWTEAEHKEALEKEAKGTRQRLKPLETGVPDIFKH